METLLGLRILGVLAYWLYKSGKRTGSRKGYGVGHRGGAVGVERRWRQVWHQKYFLGAAHRLSALV